jgi:high-affinity iron transporter
VLFSVSYWLISKVEAHKWQKFIREKVSVALEHGSGGALMLIAFLAVYREGAETALFYQALFSQAHGAVLPLTLGIVAGSVALAVVFVLLYRFGVKIPMRAFFAATSLLLYYMAFVFAGRGIRELQEGNVLSMTPLPHVPDISWLGLFPTVETVAIQLVLLVLFAFALVRTFVFTTAPAPSR